MKRLLNLFLVLICTLALTSCLLQTAPALASSALSGPASEGLSQVAFYQVGDLYYAGFRTRYICKPEPVKVAVLLAHGTPDMKLWEIEETAGEEEDFYILLTAEQAHNLLGASAQEPPAGTPRLIRGKDWKPAAAQPVPARREYHFNQMQVTADAELSSDEACCMFDKRNMAVNLPLRVGWDAAYKFPFAVVLFVSVDIPGTVLLNVVGVVAGMAGAL